MARELQGVVKGLVKVAEPLARYTTFRIGGPADVLVEPADEEDLARALAWAQERGVPVTLLGGGSNVLVPDEGLPGLVLRIGLDGIRWERPGDGGRRGVVVGAGTVLARLVHEAARRGCRGLEPCAGIPGTVGGALVMNAGTRDGSIGQVVDWVRVVEPGGQLAVWPREQCGFAYRSSRMQAEGIPVVAARLVLDPGDPQAILQEIRRHTAYRQRTQPLRYPNCGSVFKNPPGDASGRLIEACGLKGLRRGRAQISEQHANFIINLGGATAEDVLDLMTTAWRCVRDRFGVILEPEVRLLGALARRWPPDPVAPAPAAGGDGA
ncbi:UDP-N-acetylenolpyruvoylglucosamine reductase [Thermaerobacter marianensis DSM 12885]|uniref:UDP-N-acetylenolpyruvoylglucosamine reductase n=1 Tax=Thermaerobacter marianensis (strain ATCC 700841 / DSM 12885 / JCM 10246 / 7p75a) TaxID=644966 RepID=E6SIY9_THEM7|nr:UDP-N-acetylmuramate dehydrogenase [Thermaerobacter marianensis]ADU50984.1 UDP-N-acetylenolpyruvoylglucosamine reductase [Thermaerobacter marianensis DSM 12885]